MKGSVFITGVTGFLGTQVTKLVLEETDFPVIVLVRGEDLPDVKRRLERAWWDWPDMVKEIGKRVQVYKGDISLIKLGLNDSSYQELVTSVEYMIHLAADVRFREPSATIRKTNVTGVRNILELAHNVYRSGRLIRFSYVSTAYVAGLKKGNVLEDDLTDRYGFANYYERSKFEAESLVREAGKELPISVFRPGMVVGNSKSGAVKTFNTIYFPLRLYLSGKWRFVPVNPSQKINMVPCDYVSEAIVKLTFMPEAEGGNFHLTLSAESLPTIRELIEFTQRWADKNLHLQLPAPIFLPVRVGYFRWLNRFLSPKSTVGSLLMLSPYFEENRSYGREHIDGLLGTCQIDWKNFIEPVLAYAVKHGFMHRSERTVHEQVYFRLSGKSRPVRYHDVINGKIVRKSPEEIREEVRMAASSMHQMGIQAGDRIAIVGLNSTNYFVLDVAIGLIGGISVPLYYSSPVRELKDIINACGARLLFVGMPGILEKLVADPVKIPVVSFARQESEIELAENMMGWKNFLALGASLEDSLKSPVGLSDTATLRYTSGTTGCPKGAVFTHAGLRWMSETLASLPPWKARTNKLVYLSFLPLNHVVEGILGTYALYYAPASVDVYYLENFHELQQVIHKIQPTIFFSVPRFYEKVWEKAAQSFLGRKYLGCSEGFKKRFWGRILCTVIKKTAGIGRCAQLIVGSAPVSTTLLHNFREIGIEIHNAYGLTEAPLITLNRFMDNQIGTLGEALPETQIRIAEDGEILVQGPQVMKRYFQDTDQKTIENGWLHTGDMGFFNKDNTLVLSGRKKEMIINSYGKNINPVKIELMLREATGVNQIMIFGDNMPFCTALFWGVSKQDPAVVSTMEQGIQKTNQQLSHPEQVKKWAVLEESLTIEGGDLTPNLKMIRAAIGLKYSEVIMDLYK